MVKLVVSDIDGTLVGDGQGAEFLSPEYFQEIERLYDKGIRFMVCSGRQRQSVKKMFAPVADKIFLGCDGGSLVFDHEKLLFSKAIQKKKPGKLWKMRLGYHCVILWFAVPRGLIADGKTVNYTVG